MYEERGIDYTKKAIIFSDGLDFKKAKELNEQCQLLGFKCMSQPYCWLRFVV
jgi:nicotinate phosphoribosyltransferase